MNMVPRLRIQRTIVGRVAAAIALAMAWQPAVAGALTFDLTTYEAGGFACGLAHGDINGDGWLDLVTANSSSGTLSVLLNPGDGGPFQPGPNVTVPAGPPRDVALADLDEDGDNDLLVTVRQGSAALLVYRNLGGGTFAAPAPYGSSMNAFSLQVADFNRDDRVDVAIAHGFFNANVDVFLNHGAGLFAQPVSYLIGSSDITYVADVAAGDVNGDGAVDLVGVLANSGDVTLLLNSGNGTFTSSPAIEIATLAPSGVALADLDGDGDNDLVVVDESNGGALIIARNSGAGTFGDHSAEPIPGVVNPFTTPMTPGIGDVDCDGLDDIAVAGQVLLNLGHATFAPPIKVSGQEQSALANLAADMDGDGLIDLAFTWFGSPKSALEVFMNVSPSWPGPSECRAGTNPRER
jgi:hypothetical protein